jgi:hypothetical protein
MRQCQDLPAELWLKIFALATGLPGDLIDPAPPYLVEASPHQWPTDRLEKAEKAKLKLSLTLVCRSWRQMATVILYEIVNICQMNYQWGYSRVTAFRQTLETTTGTNGVVPMDGLDGEVSNDVELGYGRWVKQLHLKMDFISVEDVAAIVLHCPNLRTLSIEKGHMWNRRTVERILVPAFPGALLRLELLSTWVGEQREVLREFAIVLHRHPSIKAASLRCPPVYFGDEDIPSSQLKALTLINPGSGHLRSLTKWDLPSLTHLTLKSTAMHTRPELLSVIQHLGPQLLFLDVSPGSITAEKDDYVRLCSSIFSSCPRLRGFVLYGEDILSHKLSSESLTHLVIPVQLSWYSAQCQMGKVTLSNFPALKCVRLLAGRDPLYPLFPRRSSPKWVIGCRDRGIRVEDEDGMDLLDPYYPVKIHRDERWRYNVNMDGYLKCGSTILSPSTDP